jgi:hypothetical protein
MNDVTAVEVELDPLTDVVAPPPPADDKATPTQTPTEPVAAIDPVQARINEITAKRYAEQRRADAAEAELAKLKGAPAPIAKDPPKLEDFDFDETRHNAAMIEYQVETQLSAKAAEGVQQSKEDAARQAADAFAVKEAEFANATPGYSDAVANLPRFPADTLDAIYSLDNGPQMAHYLGTHLDVADRIANASPVQAAMELGRIAASMAATAPIITPSGAPEPVETLSGAGGVSKDMDDMSMDEIMAL